MRKTDILKTENKCTNFAEQKGTRYIRGERLYLHYRLSLLSSAKLCLRFLLKYFVREIKGFYQSFLENEVNFRDMMNVSLNISAKNYNFKKLGQVFVDETEEQ